LESERPVLARLQTVPGIDLIGAALLWVKIGSDRSAFGNADRLISWGGLCPGHHESAGKRSSGYGRNPYVRRLLCEFAHAARRTRSVFPSTFRTLVIRCGPNPSSASQE
jgi:transposase